MTAATPVRVVLIDDSAVSRRVLRTVLERAGITVVGEAGDGRAGRDQIVQLDPDVITLDLDMPGVDGITLLKAIGKSSPRPVVVVSGKVAPGSAAEMAALEAGAAHVLVKPGPHAVAAFSEELVKRIRQAAASAVRFQRGGRQTGRTGLEQARFVPGQLIAIGSSTGGPGALREVLSALPPHSPPIVITQHIPPDQPSSLAERLGSALKRNIATAREGEVLTDGMVRIAPPDRHLTIELQGNQFRTRVTASAVNLPPNMPRPSVDVMFQSVAAAAGRRAVGVILTGMGDDGAVGLGAMRAAGAPTIAQDEATSVVFGMPRAAIQRGAAGTIASLDRIAMSIVRSLQRAATQAA
jgi:two-component system, chemotaxis family, protein-glutamate methylesterase/glutaminase